jgi:hypothetical protein
MRTLHEITCEIRKDWKPVHYTAKPYLEAMEQLNSISDDYYLDSGTSMVLYFLSNAQTWKGEVARRCKAELNTMVNLERKAR